MALHTKRYGKIEIAADLQLLSYHRGILSSFLTQTTSFYDIKWVINALTSIQFPMYLIYCIKQSFHSVNLKVHYCLNESAATARIQFCQVTNNFTARYELWVGHWRARRPFSSNKPHFCAVHPTSTHRSFKQPRRAKAAELTDGRRHQASARQGDTKRDDAFEPQHHWTHKHIRADRRSR